MRLSRSAAILAAAAFALSGCGTSDSTSPQSVPPTTAAVDDGDSQAAPALILLVDGWAKAVEQLPDAGAMPAMTGVFGTLTNTGDADIRLVGGSSPVAGTVELHETVMSDAGMVMREADGGLVVPAGGSLVLEPGGHHIMLMDLTGPVPAGADVEVVLQSEDGAEATVVAPARTFAGAEETYAPAEPAHTSSDS
ncbi:copper chaperone PCu(A)C [Nostocoides sp. F2B08]|uniref:copper chaperone PCu(A)C n=1 Tax=Nostocoides sp. F2B08 TaxID=2653936 RepID=UPI001262DB4E|nr:copper chaperone PCu(A)C [Tetrasphaera sp. F2B08]KAB7745995.1 copper chaperone PCu(A)C [Tetrasphaera sp. F2B08]